MSTLLSNLLTYMYIPFLIYCNTSVLLFTYLRIDLSALSLMDICLLVFSIMYSVSGNIFVCVSLFIFALFLSYRGLEMNLLGHILSVFSTLIDIFKLFCNMVVPFTHSPAACETSYPDETECFLDKKSLEVMYITSIFSPSVA